MSFEQMVAWSNVKVMQAEVGREGNVYPDCTNFTSREICQHVGLYIFHGLVPSPQLADKFKSQTEDIFHGKDFIKISFDSNLERRHKIFKEFFSMQDPSIHTPSRDAFPYWKVRPLLKWMNFLFFLVWALEIEFLIDKMTMCFKGKHHDKRRITYKQEGDGFQDDALCNAGFTYQVYMRNDPLLRKYRKEGLSPLHSRCMALFDSNIIFKEDSL